MRVLAALLVMALAAVPMMACGGGGGGCSGQCGFCNSAFDCCEGGAVCAFLSDGSSRCTTFTPVFCKR